MGRLRDCGGPATGRAVQRPNNGYGATERLPAPLPMQELHVSHGLRPPIAQLPSPPPVSRGDDDGAAPEEAWHCARADWLTRSAGRAEASAGGSGAMGWRR